MDKRSVISVKTPTGVRAVVAVVALAILLYGSVTSSAALLTVTNNSTVIAFVQVAATNTGTASSYRKLTTPFAAPNSAGNCIVVGVTAPSSSTVAVSDTRGNTYTKAYSLALSWGSRSFQLWYATNIAAGANSLIGTFSRSGSYEQMAFAEYQGVALAAPLDVVIGKGGRGGTAPATLSTGTIATTANGDLVVVIANNQNGTLTAGTGFTNRSGAVGGVYFEDYTQTNAGSTAGTVVDNASSDRYAIIMAAFMPAVSASGVAPAIVTQPASATVLVGTSASFSVTASGSVPLNYQWSWYGTNVSGATASAWATPATVLGDSNSMVYVTVSNAFGGVTSSNAYLYVTNGLSITSQPQSQTVAAGSSATFTVAAAGAAPLNYQWQFNGTNLSGATSTSLTLTGVQPANTGSYTVVVTNSAGLVTSAVAVLTVLVPPTITTQPLSQNATQGASVTFTVAASGSTPFSYQWQFNSSNISSATASSYTRANVQLTNAGSYSVVVSNFAGLATSSNATLTVTAPPSITAQPANQSVAAGSTATFSLTAAGTPPLAYQWSVGSNPISGATTNSYSVVNCQLTNSGSNYSCVVTNFYGSITSAVATLTVVTSSPAITFIQAGGSNTTSSSYSTLTMPFASTNTPGNFIVLGTLTPAGSTVTVSDTKGDTWTRATSESISWASYTFSCYYATNIAGGANSVIVSISPSGNYGQMAFAEYRNVAQAAPLDSIIATTGTGGTAPATLTSGRVTPTANGDLIVGLFQNQNGNFTVLSPFTNRIDAGTWLEDYTQPVAASIAATVQDSASSDPFAAITIAFKSGTPSSGTAPTISMQPANQTVLVGNTATFSVTASGTAPLSYQWYLVRHQRQRCDGERLGDPGDGPGQLELNGVCHGRQRLRPRHQQQR